MLIMYLFMSMLKHRKIENKIYVIFTLNCNPICFLIVLRAYSSKTSRQKNDLDKKKKFSKNYANLC